LQPAQIDAALDIMVRLHWIRLAPNGVTYEVNPTLDVAFIHQQCETPFARARISALRRTYP
jgi:hypothetical protein